MRNVLFGVITAGRLFGVYRSSRMQMVVSTNAIDWSAAMQSAAKCDAITQKRMLSPNLFWLWQAS